MSIKVYHNSRNEAASTDGRIWWRGTATDATTIALEELQPVSALLPADANIPQATVAKARAVFISALRKVAPTVAPDDDAERSILRKTWDDATAFAASHMVIAIGKPVFDHHLCVVGAADAVCSAQNQNQSSADAAPSASIPFCYAPDGYEFAGELNALTRILYNGLQNAPTECPCGFYGIHAYSRAVAALVMRDQTEWHRRKMEELPF